MVFSLMLLAPSWGGMLNGLLTMRGAFHKLRTDPILKFFLVALTFYGMSTLEGPLMSIKSINLWTHYTDYTVAHVHSGALGWVGGMVFGMAYWMAPRLSSGKELYSQKLANTHFWLFTVGLILYVTSMWTAGIMQGMMWFATTPDGSLKYPQFLETVLALKPLYWGRMFGGSMYLVGAVLCLWNIWKTIDCKAADEVVEFVPERHPHKPVTFHEKLEHRALPMSALALVVILIGGLVEFLPTFLVKSNVPTMAEVKPYTALEVEGRDVYVKEGCYNCHSQMIRPIREEVLRYGEPSQSGEFVYDHPFQFGSKRTGPDLARLGGKYPHLWHYRHMIDPRSTSPGSIMPAYAWLETEMVDISMTSKKMEVLRTLGAPYSDDEIARANADYAEQAISIVDNLKNDGVTTNSDSELIALIAYMQRLGVDGKKAAAAQKQSTKVE
jgi:cytochrome c oxidase cbb3-type subunit I/II